MGKRVALVTGAGKGIGAETAKLLARRHYFVCINYHRDSDQADGVASCIRQSGGACATLRADVGEEAEVAAMMDEIRDRYGPLSCLINNAAYTPARGAFDQMSSDELHRVFSVNVYGVVFTTKHAVSHMRHLGKGTIVNVSSESAIYGGNRMAAYAASKGAINSLTRGLARELAPLQIRVNAVSPGIIDAGAHRLKTEHERKALGQSIPLGRMGRSEEVAEVIAWLLSDLSSYVSGSIVPVAGAR